LLVPFVLSVLQQVLCMSILESSVLVAKKSKSYYMKCLSLYVKKHYRFGGQTQENCGWNLKQKWIKCFHHMSIKYQDIDRVQEDGIHIKIDNTVKRQCHMYRE
ncbi:hypothetical protein JTE90_022100, partial [Oedothorax gibbosus]